MTTDPPGVANSWATEHDGFEDDRTAAGAQATGAAAPGLGAAPSTPEGSRPRRRSMLVAGAVLSAALVAEVGALPSVRWTRLPWWPTSPGCSVATACSWCWC